MQKTERKVFSQRTDENNVMIDKFTPKSDFATSLVNWYFGKKYVIDQWLLNRKKATKLARSIGEASIFTSFNPKTRVYKIHAINFDANHSKWENSRRIKKMLEFVHYDAKNKCKAKKIVTDFTVFRPVLAEMLGYKKIREKKGRMRLYQYEKRL